MKIFNWFKEFWNNITNSRFKVTSDGSIGDEETSPFPGLGLDSSYDTPGGSFVKGLLGLESGDSSQPNLLSALTSWLNSMSGEHMVNADVERNSMQMQNVEDVYQRQVTGMQKAGLNPALMYQSGASSAPSAPAPSQPGLNMSDIMQALLFDKQSALLDSQIRNTNAKTDREVEETNRLKLINKYYPQVTETDINKSLSAIGLTEQQISESKSRVDLQELDKDLKELDKIIRKAEADESSEFYKARREYEQAKDDESKARAAELGVRAAMESIEKEYMDTYSVKMGSNDYIAIAACLAGLFDIDIEKTIDDANEGTQNFISRLRSKSDPSYNNHNSHGGRK